MRFTWIAAVAAALFSAAPTIARPTFVALPPNTPFTAKIGSGGTKTTLEGVEFWTGGAPARGYRLLGFLMDSSEDRLLASVGSRQLARKVRDAGGDALIVVPMSDLPVEAQIALRNVQSAPAYQFWVVSYLRDSTPVVADDHYAGQIAEWQSWTEEQCRDPDAVTRRGLSPSEMSIIRADVRKTIAEIVRETANAPEAIRKRNDEMHRLTMAMLDCQEQQQVANATDEAIRGGVGTEIRWVSQSRPNVSGRSIATAEESLADGVHCMTVTDIIIVDGEEVRAPKRMCRARGASGYSKV